MINRATVTGQAETIALYALLDHAIMDAHAALGIPDDQSVGITIRHSDFQEAVERRNNAPILITDGVGESIRLSFAHAGPQQDVLDVLALVLGLEDRLTRRQAVDGTDPIERMDTNGTADPSGSHSGSGEATDALA